MRIDSTLKEVVAVGVAVCLAAVAGGCGGDGGGNPVQPGRTWALTVSVASEQRVPVKSATVRVADGPDASKTALTDESGTALFSALHEGTFNIEVTAPEFYPATASVTLTTSRTVTVTMKERNRAPVITSLVSRGGLASQPSGLADVAQALDIVATVTDVETAVGSLTFDWSADAGTVAGSGPTARWQAPATATPAAAKITVTVTERFTEPGSTVVHENKTTGELEMQVHAFTAENAALGRRFLNDFSNSALAAETVINNSFSTSARCTDGRTHELEDVIDNRNRFEIVESRIGAASVAIHFNSTNPFRGRPGDAWIDIPCGWTSIIKADGSRTVANGTCKLTAIYDTDRWALCWSEMEPADSASAAVRFMR